MRASNSSDILSAAFLFGIVAGLVAFVASDGVGLTTVFAAAVSALAGVLFACDRSAGEEPEEEMTPAPARARTVGRRGPIYRR